MDYNRQRTATLVRLLLAAITISEMSLRALSNIQNAHACSATPRRVGECTELNVSCAKNERILIRDALYGFRYKDLDMCVNLEETCIRENNCCPMYAGDELMEYDVHSKYEVYRACSWKNKCIKKSNIGWKYKQNSKYSVLKYECIKEKPVIHFCQDAYVTGNSINIIFDGQERRNTHPSDCVCNLTYFGNRGGYRLSAPDLRLMSEYKNCSSEAALSGLGNTNIACSYLFRNASFSKLLIGNTEIKLSFKSAPEFVWIKTDVEGFNLPSQSFQYATKGLLSIKCFKSVRNPTDTGATGAASTSGISVPIVAIIVPVVLLTVVLAAIGIFVCRKRHNKGEDSSKLGHDSKHKANGEIPIPDSYDKLFTLGAVNRTDDNYIELEAENTYATINPEYVSNTNDKSERQNDRTNESTVNYAKHEINAPYYNTDNPSYSDHLENTINKNSEQTQQTNSEEDDREYFVLEPENVNYS